MNKSKITDYAITGENKIANGPITSILKPPWITPLCSFAGGRGNLSDFIPWQYLWFRIRKKSNCSIKNTPTIHYKHLVKACQYYITLSLLQGIVFS